MPSTDTISKKAGLPPGSLVHLGRHFTNKVKISVIDYDAEYLSETICKSTEECFPYKETDTVSWINVDGLHDTDTIASIGNHFELHPLLLEEVLNTLQRPKFEEFDDYLFLTLKQLAIDKESDSVASEHISLVLGKGWVISFREHESEIFLALQERLREIKGNIRKKGADYLFYRLIDSVVDNYFFVIDHINEALEDLEEHVLYTPDDHSLKEIQHLKKQLIILRKAVIPLREAIITLDKEPNILIEESTTRYLRDVYEHIIHITESIDVLRDTLSNIMEMYQSGVSNKTNQVMQVLTIIATIFMPLTFITGIYGMNFTHMPELHLKYGYFGVWGIMVIISVIMAFYFRRKRWF